MTSLLAPGAGLDSIPRIPLVLGPTPLHPAPRLSAVPRNGTSATPSTTTSHNATSAALSSPDRILGISHSVTCSAPQVSKS